MSAHKEREEGAEGGQGFTLKSGDWSPDIKL